MEEKDYCIELFLRYFINEKVIKYLEKKKCEVCGSTENLRVHHNKELMFVDILRKSLDDLNIEYKRNHGDYTKDEMLKLKVMVLGYHLYGKFHILCENCHIETHQRITKNVEKVPYKFLIKYKWQYEYYKLKFPECTPEEFFCNFNKFYINEILPNYLNKKLFLLSTEQIEFRDIIRNDLIKEQFAKEPGSIRKDYDNIKNLGMRGLNTILKTYKIGYEIISKQESKNFNRNKSYWLLAPESKGEEEENINKEQSFDNINETKRDQK
jgi:hypothetical protein